MTKNETTQENPSPETTSQAIEAFEAADEAMIVAELRGQVLEKFCYEFTGSDGTRCRGLSWAGVKEIKGRWLPVQMESVYIERFDDEWAAAFKASTDDGKISAIGAATQTRTMKKRDGSVIPDPFAFPKATSKAQRNAIVSLMKETEKTKFIEAWLQETGRVAKLSAEKRAQRQPRKPAEKPDNGAKVTTKTATETKPASKPPAKTPDVKEPAVTKEPEVAPETAAAAGETNYYDKIPKPPEPLKPEFLPPDWRDLYDQAVDAVKDGALDRGKARLLFTDSYPENIQAVKDVLAALPAGKQA